jgi:endonuclease/exonuclease/phosphatase family metal-dependent hydrolase
MTRLTIVSLNAWGGAVWPALGDWVADTAPDVLCLQEMIRAPVHSPEWLVYADPYRRLDQRADLFSDISARLPAHQAIFAPAARGPLHDARGRVFTSEHGLGLWVARHLAIAEYASAFVHGRYRPDGWGPEPVPRTMQMARLVAPGTGAGMVVAHLHGLRDPSGKGDTPERAAQAEAVAAALAAFQHGADEPMVLAGDLNLLPGSAFFGRMAELGLSDLVTANGIADTRTALYAKPQRHANYMLVRDPGPVERFDAPAEPVVSDHRPLVLETGLTARP